MTIHEERAIAPSQPLPPGARFNAYRDFVVQDLEFLPHNIRYRLEVWQTPDGQWLIRRRESRRRGVASGT